MRCVEKFYLPHSHDSNIILMATEVISDLSFLIAICKTKEIQNTALKGSLCLPSFIDSESYESWGVMRLLFSWLSQAINLVRAISILQ